MNGELERTNSSRPLLPPQEAAARAAAARAAAQEVRPEALPPPRSELEQLHAIYDLKYAAGVANEQPLVRKEWGDETPLVRKELCDRDSCGCGDDVPALTDPSAWIAGLEDEEARERETGWLAMLGGEVFRVMRMKGTEEINSGAYNEHFAAGTYACASCALPLYEAAHKFKSGHGWPAFCDNVPGALTRIEHGKKVEIVCAGCDGHVGHVFSSKRYPKPHHERHCVNSIALRFVPLKSAEEAFAVAIAHPPIAAAPPLDVTTDGGVSGSAPPKMMMKLDMARLRAPLVEGNRPDEDGRRPPTPPSLIVQRIEAEKAAAAEKVAAAEKDKEKAAQFQAPIIDEQHESLPIEMRGVPECTPRRPMQHAARAREYAC